MVVMTNWAILNRWVAPNLGCCSLIGVHAETVDLSSTSWTTMVPTI